MTRLRLGFALCLIASLAYLGAGYASSQTTQDLTTYQKQADLPRDERDQIVGERRNMTVATGQKSPTSGSKALYAFSADGRLYYYNERRGIGDVDPSPEGKRTILMPPQDRLSGEDCYAASKCSWQYIERVNLTTGETQRLYEFNTPRHSSSNWHDVDRINEHEYIVASIAYDGVRIINVTSGVVEWEWNAQAEYNLSSGGPWPYDWTHVNDVDVLPDGRIMVSLRNQDQVVFIDRETGLQENWTLGCDGCYEILHEQHNPDYIPESEGGPAVLVADSENNRIVEYQRVNGSWERSWVWQDSRIQWPRDADRLPNGNTLIADSHGNRIIEVNRKGEIVWRATAPNVYNVERLGTGDGSTGGPSAVQANLTTRTADDRPLYVNGSAPVVSYSNLQIWWTKLSFILPDWMGVAEVLIAAELVAVCILWLLVEMYWLGVRVRLPIRLTGKLSPYESWLSDTWRWAVKALVGLTANLVLLTVWVELTVIPAEIGVLINWLILSVFGYLAADRWVWAATPSPDSLKGVARRYASMQAVMASSKVLNYVLFVALLWAGTQYHLAWVLGAIAAFAVTLTGNRVLWRTTST